MPNPHPSLTGLRAHTDKERAKKLARLVKYHDSTPTDRKRLLNKDEQYMDMTQIEAYADHTLEIDSEDIKERTVALGGAISFYKLKQELATKAEVTSEEDDAIKTILQAARKVNSK